MDHAGPREPGRSNWIVVWHGILLIASISAIALHLGAIAWSGTWQRCVGAVDIALILGSSVGAISLFILAAWIHPVVITVCVISITSVGFIASSYESLCGTPLDSSFPWPSAILVAIYGVRSILLWYRSKQINNGQQLS